MWYAPEGRRLATSGVVLAARLKSSRSSATPARPAIAGRWTTAFVEPPTAISTRTAFSNAARVRIFDGRRSSWTISTMRRPAASASRSRPASGAGTAAMPGSVMPSASAIAAIVLAVPMTAQVPAVVARLPSMRSISSAETVPARCIAQKRRQSVQAPRRSP